MGPTWKYYANKNKCCFPTNRFIFYWRVGGTLYFGFVAALDSVIHLLFHIDQQRKFRNGITIRKYSILTYESRWHRVQQPWNSFLKLSVVAWLTSNTVKRGEKRIYYMIHCTAFEKWRHGVSPTTALFQSIGNILFLATFAKSRCFLISQTFLAFKLKC